MFEHTLTLKEVDLVNIIVISALVVAFLILILRKVFFHLKKKKSVKEISINKEKIKEVLVEILSMKDDHLFSCYCYYLSDHCSVITFWKNWYEEKEIINDFGDYFKLIENMLREISVYQVQGFYKWNPYFRLKMKEIFKRYLPLI